MRADQFINPLEHLAMIFHPPAPDSEGEVPGVWIEAAANKLFRHDMFSRNASPF